MEITEIKLLANRLDLLKEFYCTMLELPILEYTPSSLSILAGSSKLIFVHSTDVVNPYYHFAFNISENKVDQALKWLQARAVPINQVEGNDVLYSESWNSDSIYFYDPAGNIVEFIARHSLRQGSNAKGFSALDILNISEIGLPSEDVLDLSAHLQEKYEEPVYRSGNAMFTPIGDEEGLMILSSLDRNWLGSSKKVAIFPMEIVLTKGTTQIDFVLQYPYQITLI
ncbi:VOC family protein [Cohnella cholangitidis]|uniref:Ring-cleaving dioxygenase n=1 Tax=Cohnella cholangitidis TaxID=2598458 RepID=A0A7G5BSU5_9BACL|nr:VOC family protein [Cohnella cholangitidis]QMV40029.1 ring-cleaving dioxygenase [Cohnella cholangitidis]